MSPEKRAAYDRIAAAYAELESLGVSTTAEEANEERRLLNSSSEPFGRLFNRIMSVVLGPEEFEVIDEHMAEAFRDAIKQLHEIDDVLESDDATQ